MYDRKACKTRPCLVGPDINPVINTIMSQRLLQEDEFSVERVLLRYGKHLLLQGQDGEAVKELNSQTLYWTFPYSH